MMTHTIRLNSILATVAVAVSAMALTSCDLMLEATDDYTPAYGVAPGSLSISSGWNVPAYPWYNWNAPYWPSVPPALLVGPPTRPGGNFPPAAPPQSRPPQQLAPTRPGQGNDIPQPLPPTGQRPGAPTASGSY